MTGLGVSGWRCKACGTNERVISYFLVRVSKSTTSTTLKCRIAVRWVECFGRRLRHAISRFSPWLRSWYTYFCHASLSPTTLLYHTSDECFPLYRYPIININAQCIFDFEHAIAEILTSPFIDPGFRCWIIVNIPSMQTPDNNILAPETTGHVKRRSSRYFPCKQSAGRSTTVGNPVQKYLEPRNLAPGCSSTESGAR